MEFDRDRRSALKAGAALAAAAALPASLETAAQAKPTIRFAAVFSEKDIRADMIRMLAKDIEADFKVETFYGGTLFKQGTELVALQRDNLEMGNIAPQDISKQLPAWSILTSAYLFRDANHLNAFFAGDLGAQMKKMVEDKLKVKILGPTFFGTRQVGLKPKKKIATPADLAGIKLRMPPGDAWQLLGRSLGANPTPMAYAEVYTGLQTGAIDGQDNPLPNVQNMKFYEVMSQIVLTSHLVGFDLLSVNLKTWNAMPPARQKSFQAAADKAINWSAAEHLKREAELAAEFRKQGLEVYAPDVSAFRAHAQKIYLASDEAKDWPKGMLDKINAMK
jgi:TRAP-type C4-dicarboxylate transport system substrate-binding protein